MPPTPRQTDVRRPPTARLPRQPVAPQARGREVRGGLLATLGLLVVLVGVPVGLALGLGNPLPTTAPSRDWLDTQVSTTVVLNVLAAVVWLLWAHFAVCVITEWRAARRGSGLPGDVPLGGGSQMLARRLVASALLLAGAAALAPQSGATAATAPERPTSTVSASQAGPASLLQGVVDDLKAAVAETEAQVAATQVGQVTKTYLVQPPDGRRYDSLWDISERTLGDPLRYKEIFALNKDRPQPDGRTLVEADLIHPGWTLLMPDDARGPGIHVATPPPVAPPVTPAAPAAPVAPAGGGDTAVTDTAVTDTAVTDTAVTDAGLTDAAARPDAPAAQADGTGLTAERGLLGGGLLAAGLLLALTARRGPYARPTGGADEERLRLAADPGRAGLLDRELRRLAHACAEQGLALPDVALAYAGERDLVLHLAAPAPSAPPQPWQASGGARVWTLDVPVDGDLEPTPDVAAPYPALVNVATVGGYELLVDLETAPGVLSLMGPGGRDAAVSVAVELATNTWSDGVQVTLVGFGDDLAGLAPAAITTVARLDEVLPGLRAEANDARSALRALGVDGVLSGRLARGAARRLPRVLVLSGPPSAEDAAVLADLVRGGRTPFAVVVVGATASSTWHFTVGATGQIDLGVFGVSGVARTLSPREYGPVLELLRAADDDRVAAAAEVATLSPRGALEGPDPTPTPGVSTDGPPAPWALLPALAGVPVELAQPAPAVASVRLLGPVLVVAPGPLDEAARALLTEVVIAAALHRDGLHEAVLRSLVWPRGVQDEVVAATLGQVQVWLGTDALGVPRLRRAQDGRYRLSDEVHCDVDALRTAAARARGDSELAVLQAGLAMVDGEAFSATPAGRYRWLVYPSTAAQTRVVVTAVARRAAALSAGAGDPASAVIAVRLGIAAVPAAEALWRDLLRLTPPPEAPALANELYRVLAGLGARPEPATDALVQQLVPGYEMDTAQRRGARSA